MTLKKTLGLIASLIFGLQLYGCSSLSGGGVATDANYRYKDAWVEQTYQAGLNHTYESCLKTAEQMGMKVDSRSLTAMTGEIKAVKDGEDYWFKLTEKPGNMTTLSIKSGAQGGKDASETIHESVVSRL